jgi:hypothetical protein
MKNDKFLKLHTWIVFGVALLFAGIAFLIMFLMASGSISAKLKDIEKVEADLKSKTNSKGEIKLLEEQKGKLEKQRETLWLDNYERQEAAKVFDWPPGDANFRALGSNKALKFGDEILVNNNELAPQTMYKAFDSGYSKLAAQLAPVRFANGSWKSTFRYVTNWGTKTAVEVPWMWLALEDFWVQKAILLPIMDFNDEAATFVDVTPKPAKGEEDNLLKRTLRNRIWELKLEVADPQGKPTIKGSLRNLSTRLRTLGVEKSMKVKIWFKDKVKEEHDFELTIRGELVPGSGSIEIKPEAVKNVAELHQFHKVQQEFDEATVPVRLVKSVEMTKLDHKNRTATLEMPAHIAKIVEADAAAAPAATSENNSMPGSPMSSTGGKPGGFGSVGGVGEGGSSSAASGAKAGPWETVLKGNKARYVKRTTDVRRMPIAMSVVVETDAVNELLVAYANSPMRFHITQTQWQRFNGSLPNLLAENTPASVTPPAGPPVGGGGRPNGDDDDSSPGPRGGPVGVPPVGMFPGGPGGTGPGFGQPGGAAVSSNEGRPMPSEANAGLSELAIYGVISLYEKAAPAKVEDKGTTPMNEVVPSPVPDPAKPMPDPTKPSDPVQPMPDPNKPEDPVKPVPDPNKK